MFRSHQPEPSWPAASPAGASRTQPQLRNAGLPDPVEATQLEAWAIQHGVSYDDLKSRFGGSPWVRRFAARSGLGPRRQAAGAAEACANLTACCYKGSASMIVSATTPAPLPTLWRTLRHRGRFVFSCPLSSSGSPGGGCSASWYWGTACRLFGLRAINRW